MRGWRTVAIAMLGASALACTPAVSIERRCVIVAPPAEVVGERLEWGRPWYGSVGMLSETEIIVFWFGQAAFEPTLSSWVAWAPASPSGLLASRIGFATGARPTWVPHGESLVGQIWITDEDPLTTDQNHMVHSVTIARGSEPILREIFVHAQYGPSGGVIFRAGPEGLLPAAMLGEEPIIGLVAMPFECEPGGGALTEHQRLMLARPTDREALPVFWSEDPCSLDFDARLGLQVEAPDLFVLPSGDLGVVYRRGGVRPSLPMGSSNLDTVVSYLRIRPDRSVAVGPVTVGHLEERLDPYEVGRQPHAVAVGDGRVLMTERYGDCPLLVVFRDDGTDVHDAPWQLTCRSDRTRDTSVVMLAAMGDGALLVWEERERLEWSERILPGEPYDEGVYAAYINAAGQRASEIIRVTDEAARTYAEPPASGTTPGSFLPFVATDGEDFAAITWSDQRGDTSGIYMARLRCEPL